MTFLCERKSKLYYNNALLTLSFLPSPFSLLSGNLFIDEPLPENGYIDLDPSKPGFGVTLNRNELKLVRPCPRHETELGTRESLLAMANSVPEHDEWLGRAKKIQTMGVSEMSDKGKKANPKRD